MIIIIIFNNNSNNNNNNNNNSNNNNNNNFGPRAIVRRYKVLSRLVLCLISAQKKIFRFSEIRLAKSD